jgi:hypothetical protein
MKQSVFFFISGFSFAICVILVYIAFGFRELWSQHFIYNIGESIIALMISIFFALSGYLTGFLENKVVDLFFKKRSVFMRWLLMGIKFLVGFIGLILKRILQNSPKDSENDSQGSRNIEE